MLVPRLRHHRNAFACETQGLDFVMLRRDWVKDQRHLERQMTNFVADDAPLRLIIFPEGTTINTTSLDKCTAFAKKVTYAKYILQSCVCAQLSIVMHPWFARFAMRRACSWLAVAGANLKTHMLALNARHRPYHCCPSSATCASALTPTHRHHTLHACHTHAGGAPV
jgi:hypothetical protein